MDDAVQYKNETKSTITFSFNLQFDNCSVTNRVEMFNQSSHNFSLLHNYINVMRIAKMIPMRNNEQKTASFKL